MDDENRIAERIARSVESLSDALERLAGEFVPLREAVERIDRYVEAQQFEEEVERRVADRMREQLPEPKTEAEPDTLVTGYPDKKLIGAIVAILGAAVAAFRAKVEGGG
mgnify:CR=1 FL=1